MNREGQNVSIFVSEISALLKSPGGWFFFSNAVLYTQTDPLIAVFYLCALAFQRSAHYANKGKSNNSVVNLIVGSQGILAVNGILTFVSALTTAFIGTPELAVSGFLFGAANVAQSIVYSSANNANDKMRHIILAVCEFAIAIGLAMIAVNAGYSVAVSFGLIIPVLIAGAVRSFRPHWLPPGLAYLDMMFLSAMTCYEAFLTGNLANGLSRILVLFGLSRLAVLRAKNEGKRSVFEIEHFFSSRS